MLVGFVGVGVGGRVRLLLLVMRIGDGERKRRRTCEVVVKRAMDASLGAMTLQARIAGKPLRQL